jgi:hypothetical protein
MTWAVMGTTVDGRTFEDWARHVDDAAEAARAGRPVMTPPPWTVRLPRIVLNAGGSSSAIFDLKPGTYGISCLRQYSVGTEVRPYWIVGPIEVR